MGQGDQPPVGFSAERGQRLTTEGGLKSRPEKNWTLNFPYIDGYRAYIYIISYSLILYIYIYIKSIDVMCM